MGHKVNAHLEHKIDGEDDIRQPDQKLYICMCVCVCVCVCMYVYIYIYIYIYIIRSPGSSTGVRPCTPQPVCVVLYVWIVGAAQPVCVVL